MNLDELLATLDALIVIRPTRRMTQSELESYLDKAPDILRGNADHSEFRGYVFALLFYKRINDCYEEEVRTQSDTLIKAGMQREQALALARDPQNHHFITTRFWTHLRQFGPKTDLLHGQMRDAWTVVPAWAHPVHGGREGI